MSDEGPEQPPPSWPPPEGGQSPPHRSPPQQPPYQQPPYQQPQPPYWSPPPPPPPPPPYGYGPPPQYGYGPPPQYYQRPRAQTDGTAITVLVLAIASFAVVPTFFLAPAGPVLAIVALALCPSARRRIESSGGAITGEGLLTAGKIVSWVNIGLTALVVLGIIVGALAGWFDDEYEYSVVLSALG